MGKPVVEAVAADAATGGHVVDILLVDGEDAAGLGTAFPVNEAQLVFCQDRAAYRKIAADRALPAVALAQAKLPGQMAFPEMHDEQASNFAGQDADRMVLFDHCPLRKASAA